MDQARILGKTRQP